MQSLADIVVTNANLEAFGVQSDKWVSDDSLQWLLPLASGRRLLASFRI